MRDLHDQDDARWWVADVPPEAVWSETATKCEASQRSVLGWLAMPVERWPPSEDPAELVARVSARKRTGLLHAHGHRLRRADLEDCYSQATLELVVRARTRERAFLNEYHVANALEQRFLSRITDRLRAIRGRSPMEAATQVALSQNQYQDGGEDGPWGLIDPQADVEARAAGREEVRRMRELAAELTADQRLVLACHVVGMGGGEFCERFGWSEAKFRKVAVRARARLRVLVEEYETGEHCRRLADDLTAYVGHVAEGEQSDRIRRHLSNCPACAHTARELERVARGVGALLPVPPTVDPEVVHRFGILGRGLARLLPFWDTGESAAAIKAGAAGSAAAGGTGAAAAGGGSLLGLGAAKVGVVALCAAGAASGYVVCDQIGLFGGALPRERHHVATTANVAHKHPTKPTKRKASPQAAQTPPPVIHATRQSTTVADRQPRSAAPSTSSRSSSSQAGSEFGFEGAGGAQHSTPKSSSASGGSARAASAGAPTGNATSSPPAKQSTGAAHQASSEFGFE